LGLENEGILQIQNSLFDDINSWVDRGLDIIIETVDRIYPDSEYDDSELLEDE